MKRILVVCLSLFCSFLSLFSNTLFDITDGKFLPKMYDVPRTMLDGESYTQLVGGQAVVKYSYKTGLVVDTIFSVKRHSNGTLKSIDGYEFSPNESKLMVYCNVKKRYRHSFTADYYVFNIKRSEFGALSENGSQEIPLFSPNSRYVAFVRQNNIFLKKLDFNTETSITTDGKVGSILNGVPDWLYEEEFKAVRLFDWSPDSKMLAFVKLDESNVSSFAFSNYGTSAVGKNALSLYPTICQYKYPKAGEANPTASVCVYNEYYKSVKTIKLDDKTDFYIPRVKWSKTNQQFAVFKLNRSQNQLDMILADAKTTLASTIVTHDDKRYVDYSNIDYMRFLADTTHFIAVNEQDGYRHVYLYNMNGTLDRQLTKGNFDVTDVYGYDEVKKILYYQSAETSPMNRDVYSIDAKGKKTRLTDGKGTHSAYFNGVFSCYVDEFSAINSPTTFTLRALSGVALRQLENNADLQTATINFPKKELFSFTTSDNILLNGWIVKPLNFDAKKKYPMLLVQYGAPNSQRVLDKWNIDWEFYLAQNEYIVVCVDGRGTGARGSEFRKSTFQQLGVLETKDQCETAKYFIAKGYADKDRIGIWGWSFGAFETLMAMSDSEGLFKAGIAVSPVTDWRLYNSAFTERYMQSPQVNYSGYEKCSPLQKSSSLNGKLLIIHGSADDNVHLQNTMVYTNGLMLAGKQFEMQVYTDYNHNLAGNPIRRHLYKTMSEFLFKNL